MDTRGYCIYYSSGNTEYALNLSKQIRKIYAGITDLAGYEPSSKLNIYLAERSFIDRISFLMRKLYNSQSLILFTDEEYTSSLGRIRDFTTGEVISAINKESAGFASFKFGYMETWLPAALSEYLRHKLSPDDRMIIKSMLYDEAVLPVSPETEDDFSVSEIKALHRGFIYFISEQYGRDVLGAAVRNTSYYGGFLTALENITGKGKVVIESEFNRFFKNMIHQSDGKEFFSDGKINFFSDKNAVILAADEQEGLLFYDKINKSLEFVIKSSDPDSGLTDLKNFKKICSLPFDASPESVQAAYYNNNRAVVSVCGQSGTFFYIFDYNRKALVRKLFIPSLYIRELSGNHLPDSLVFSAYAGMCRDVFILNINSMYIEKITDSSSDYSSPAVLENNSILYVETSDRSLIYRYNLSDKKKSLLWMEDGSVKDLAVSKNSEIIFSRDNNGTYNIYKLDMEGGKTEPLTFFNTGAYNPVFFAGNTLIIDCYLERKFKTALLKLR